MAFGIASWFVLFGILTFIIVMKVLICGCFLRRRQQGRRREDTMPILEEVADRLYEIHQQRIRSRRAREPPPTFEDALRNSRPVSVIEIEEPPPSYDEYVNSTSAYTEGCSVVFSPSVNPADVVISMDVAPRRGITLAESNA